MVYIVTGATGFSYGITQALAFTETRGEKS